jgi:hypothetical protein
MKRITEVPFGKELAKRQCVEEIRRAAIGSLCARCNSIDFQTIVASLPLRMSTNGHFIMDLGPLGSSSMSPSCGLCQFFCQTERNAELFVPFQPGEDYLAI